MVLIHDYIVQANSGTFSTERGSGSRRRSRRLSGESTSFLSDFAYAMGEDTSSRRESLAMFTDLLDPTALEDLKRRSTKLKLHLLKQT